jgi:hypothetical protein
MAGILQIGASVNVAELKAGMEEAAGSVRSQAGQMSAAFQGLAAESEASTEQIAANWVAVAEASLAARAAQSDLRSATLAAKDAEEGDTAAVARLALAKREAAVTSAALAASMKAATVGAVEEESVLAGLTERLIGAGAAAKFAEGGMAGFAGLAGILGGGVLIGFFAHLEDEEAKSVVELDHLSAKTGISIQSLAGLKQIVAELGGEFEPVEQGLVRMVKAQQTAVEGNKATVEAFERIGISVTELAALNPEQLLYRVAEAIQSTGSHAAVAASSIAIFGKGGAALIPIFRDAGASLQGMIEKAGAASGITERTAATAREWTKDVADLGQMVRWLGVEILTPLLTIVKAVAFGFEVLGGVTAIVARTIATPFIAAAVGARDLVKTLHGLAHGDVEGAQRDFLQMKANWVDSWKSGTADIEGYMGRLKADRDSMFFAPPPKHSESAEPDVPTPATGKPAKDNTYDIEVKAEEAHRLAMLEVERKAYEEEAKLRGDSAQQQVAQLLAFNDRELRIKQDAIAELRALQGDKNTPDRQASLTGEETAAEDHAALQRVEINARTEEQIVQDRKRGEQAIEQILHQLTEAEQKSANAESEAARKGLEERERDLREELSFEKEANNSALEESIKIDQEKLKHHQMSAREAAQAEIQAVNEWEQQALQILQRMEQQELSIYGRETVEYRRMKNEEVQIAQEAAGKIEQIEQQQDNQIAQRFNQLFTSMASTITNSLNSVIEGHKTMAQAVTQIWQGLAMDVIKSIEQVITKLLVELAVAAAVNALTGGVSDIAGGLTSGELIPGATGAATAGFASGGIIPRTGFVLAHEKEGILPRSLTSMLLNVANNGGPQASSSGHTFHVNYQPIINHPMTRDDVDEHASYLFSRMRQMQAAFNS